MRRGDGLIPFIRPDAANGSLDQNAGYWLDYHGRITGIFENAEVSGLVWVKQNLVVSQGWGVSECRRGRIVGLVLRDRERERERERVKEREAHPTATSDSDQPLGLQSAIIPNRCCASIISILHSCKVTICT